jgi:hypothetical protein
MRSKNLLFYCAALVFGSFLFLATSSNSASNTFEVYAADNCDASSECINIPGTGTQQNICFQSSFCRNIDIGLSSSNTQTNNCNGGSVCRNNAGESDNTQTNNCSGGSSCINGFGETDNNQLNACQSSVCRNTGVNTNVYANAATSDCVSGGPDTTTVCQRDRTFVFPNP